MNSTYDMSLYYLSVRWFGQKNLAELRRKITYRQQFVEISTLPTRFVLRVNVSYNLSETFIMNRDCEFDENTKSTLQVLMLL